jgi:integrative and conjugative element protein (TIGR02256 family)
MIKIGTRQIDISREALNLLDSYRQLSNVAKEAGGILIGERTTNSISISKITTPNSQDKRSRFGFLRVKKPAQLIINYQYENSGGLITYLGEWHTHPEDRAHPSNTDIAMIKEEFSKSIHNLPYFVLIILGRKVDYIGLYDGDTIEYQNFVRSEDSIEKFVRVSLST